MEVDFGPLQQHQVSLSFAYIQGVVSFRLSVCRGKKTKQNKKNAKQKQTLNHDSPSCMASR